MTLDEFKKLANMFRPFERDAPELGMARKLIAVAEAAKAALEDWYCDDNYKNLESALAALETSIES